MSEGREQALRERVIRGSTEGERRAALNALVKLAPAEVSHVPRSPPWRTVLRTMMFVCGATLAAVVWGWGFIGSILAGVAFMWCSKWCGL